MTRPDIQVTGFVHPRVIPMLADADAVMRRLPVDDSTVYRALVPNTVAAYENGATSFECCIGGYGGGIAMPVSVMGMGNVPTEDVVHLFREMGVETGVDLAAVRALSDDVAELFQSATGMSITVDLQSAQLSVNVFAMIQSAAATAADQNGAVTRSVTAPVQPSPPRSVCRMSRGRRVGSGPTSAPCPGAAGSVKDCLAAAAIGVN